MANSSCTFKGMNEQELTTEYEQACGGPDRAFRLLNLYRSCTEPSDYDRVFRKAPSAREKFIKRATQEGWSKKAINLLLRLQ
jgi:hypothetical protein